MSNPGAKDTFSGRHVRKQLKMTLPNSLRKMTELELPSEAPQGLRPAGRTCQAAHPLPTPSELCNEFPLGPEAATAIAEARSQLRRRVATGLGAAVAIVGPCSIHCENAALEYAERLAQLQRRLGEGVLLVMRVYLEKPRTTVGWKGFVYDPDLSGADDLVSGLQRGRALMTQIAAMGVPIASEVLDPLVAPYLADCLTWAAVGARTTESQIHRQLASSLPCTVGFKNGTDGNLGVAADACESAARAHAHLGIDPTGRVALIRSPGNPSTHVVLRGGRSGVNYHQDAVGKAASMLVNRGLRPALLVDCSHGNSDKDYRRQPDVARAVIAQMRRPQGAEIFGVMLESHLYAGRQSLAIESPKGRTAPLQYGVSVTDGCIDFGTTEGLLSELSECQRSGERSASGPASVSSSR